MKNTVIFHNFRVTFLGKDIVRVERARAGKFFDGDTFFVPDRASLLGEPPAYSMEGNVLRFGECELLFPAGRGLRGLRLTKGGRTVYRYKGLKNSGELPPPPSTPEVFAVADRPRILIPEGGYSAARKGNFRIESDVEDIYLLLAGKDAAKLRRLYTALTGRCELVRLSTLGMWNSKYYAYTQKEAKALIADYERHNIPLDNMVIDTDWRLAENGIGYRVNKKLFPDMKDFLAYAHSHGVEVMFNDHPEPVRGANVFASREIAYREKHLKELLSIGLDTWWYDRNWQTHLISPTKDVAWETFGLYLYYDVTRRFYEERAEGRAPRRPVVMGNVVNVANGIYCGISDTASHRYSIQWTGDIGSCAYSLAQEVENLVRCGENCVVYMNSDCGGHTGNPEKEQYVRWMQYGALSPVFRPHCTNSVLRTREPWLYDEETVDIVRRYIELRYHLMPYLYANAYNAYEAGMPMFRSLALMYPHDRRAAARRDEYLLGDDILVAPVCGAVPLPLSEREYTAPVEVTFYRGIACEGEPIATATWKTLSMNLRHEPPMEGVPTYYFSAKIRTKIKLDRALRLYIRNDDGATVYLDGKCVLEDKKTHSATLIALADLAGGEHTLEIEYFQAEGEAFLGLYTAELSERDEREIYLPAGRWMDVFDGSVYTGKRTVKKRYGLASMPLFVRLGAVIPLAETAHTLKEQSFSHIVYDFYPCKTATGGGFLYEDDGETTAYKKGAFSRSDYSAEYLPGENAYLLRLKGAEGEFEGARVCTRRKVTVKYHVLKGADVVCAYLDGKAVPVRRAKRAPVFPFGTGDASPDAATLIVEFESDPRTSHEVGFLLKSGD